MAAVSGSSSTLTGEPFGAAFAAADRRTLAAVVTHLSDDPRVITDLRDRAEIEAVAARVLPPYLDGTKKVQPPGESVLAAAMSLAAGESVPVEYGPLVRSQMNIGPVDEDIPLSPPAGFSIVIIGAGLTGVLIALRLQQLGVRSFTILERATHPGGTWCHNTYPGCRVDTPSLLYSYSFDPDPGWSEYFCKQPELYGYVERSIERGGLADRLRCGVGVESMTWDERDAMWTLALRRADGGTEKLRTNFVIGATGLLHLPRWPNIPEREVFRGPSIHTALWDHNVDLAGKRVGVVGTGASANQVVPALAPEAAEILVFQRNPQWIISHPQYGKKMEGAERWLVDCVPTYSQWYRFRQFWVFGESIFDQIRVDPEWPTPRRSINQSNERLRKKLIQYIESELEGRPDLIAKTIPDYPPYTKRMVVDNGWYRALKRQNVRLVTSPIQRIRPQGIETADGREFLDAIVYATGFHTNRVLAGIDVSGSGGANIRTRLDTAPEAYHGTAVPNCPNLLVTFGPFGIPGHGGNGIFFAECAVEYIMQCLRGMFDRSWSRLVVRPEAVRAYTDEMTEAVKGYVWNIPGVTSWYKGDSDNPSVVHPKRLLDFWREAKAPDFSSFVGS
jgi:4-hydroxyacetophenone monooxygenase